MNPYDAGRADYEADVRARPTYHDGSPRKRWCELGTIERSSWARTAVAKPIAQTSPESPTP